MKQFSLNEYFKDINQKVVTRDRKQAMIIFTDAPVKNYPITGYVLGIDKNWRGPYSWSKDGEREIASPIPSANDLFFADEDDELNEFEREVKCIIIDIKNGDAVEDYKFWAGKILEIARIQLKHEIDKAYKEQDEFVRRIGYEKGLKDELKDISPF